MLTPGYAMVTITLVVAAHQWMTVSATSDKPRDLQYDREVMYCVGNDCWQSGNHCLSGGCTTIDNCICYLSQATGPAVWQRGGYV